MLQNNWASFFPGSIVSDKAVIVLRLAGRSPSTGTGDIFRGLKAPGLSVMSFMIMAQMAPNFKLCWLGRKKANRLNVNLFPAGI